MLVVGQQAVLEDGERAVLEDGEWIELEDREWAVKQEGKLVPQDLQLRHCELTLQSTHL